MTALPSLLLYFASIMCMSSAAALLKNGSWLSSSHFHVKAGDYTLDRSKETPKTKIFERDAVESVGGQCLLAPLVQGKSTTSSIEKIKEVYGSVPSNASKRKPAVFLDRDGTIIPDKEYMHKVADLEFIPGSFEALNKLTRSEYKIIVITNQSGIARGKFTEEDYQGFNQRS